MNIFSDVKQYILSIVEEIEKEHQIRPIPNRMAITVEPPKEASHGDMATNAALLLAKPLKKKPQEVAQLLAEKITLHPSVESLEIAGPGFLNIRVTDQLLDQLLVTIHQQQEDYGASDKGKHQKVNVEFVSANPTGPMHIGHARGAAYGDSLVRVLRKVGYDVTSEYYINDAGAQIAVLAESAYLRYKQALGVDIGTIPEGLYPGDYLVEVGQKLAEHYGDRWINTEKDEWFDTIKEWSVHYILEHMIKKDLSDLGVEHDVYRSEKKLHDSGKIEESLALLESKGLIYQGVLEPPKGKKPDDWEAREQTLFRSSQFGDDVDRPIKKSDGSWTYFAADIAYHVDKYERGFTHMILGLGADHGGYLKRMKAAVKAISDDQAALDMRFHQIVHLYQNGQQVKMSKRSGNFVTVREVIDSIGKDAIRFMMLTRKNDAELDFDLDKAKEQSKDNPVFYVQYAHARICSVLHTIKETMPETASNTKDYHELCNLLRSPEEKAILLKLAQWPRTIELSAEHLEPHRIVFYLQELASDFHGLWGMGNKQTHLRFIHKEDVMQTNAKALLLSAVKSVIVSGLALLNVTPIDEM